MAATRIAGLLVLAIFAGMLFRSRAAPTRRYKNLGFGFLTDTARRPAPAAAHFTISAMDLIRGRLDQVKSVWKDWDS